MLFMLGTRVWTLSRDLFMNGLSNIFHNFENFSPTNAETKSLPLHSSPILARFEITFNQLLARLKSYEHELSHWIFLKADENRYQALGEIAALVVHDLASPIQSIYFCAQELAEHPEKSSNPRYAEMLSVSAQRSAELISSLKVYLSPDGDINNSAPLEAVVQQVMLLLRTQIRDRNFQKIAFVVAPELYNLTFKIRRADLIHIILNLVSNSAKNLLRTMPDHPTIQIHLFQRKDEWATIHIIDNGTGLSAEEFENLTRFAFLPPDNLQSSRKGLGLRLIRRLVERNGGTLSIVAKENDLAGTAIAIHLPTVPSMGPEATSPPEKTSGRRHLRAAD
jgi:signal transduction histidine kinase